MDDLKSAHVTPVGGNIFSDLGFAPEEAKALKARTDRVVAEKIALREAMRKCASDIATQDEEGQRRR